MAATIGRDLHHFRGLYPSALLTETFMFFGNLLPNTAFQGTPYSKLRLLSVAPEFRR
jgi:hypothetical protein